MSRSRQSDEEKQLAKQIYANARHAGPPPATPGDEQLTRIGNKSPRQMINRLRLGAIGSEPYEARRPIARTYLAGWGVLASLLVILAGSVSAGTAIVAAGLVVGVPKAWTWAHDRIGAGLWAGSAALLIASAVAWAGGGAARDTLAHHGNPGSGMVLAFLGGLVALTSFGRRWGTSGNFFYATRRISQRDPVAMAVAGEAARREGAGRHGTPARPATDAQTLQALQDAERRER